MLTVGDIASGDGQYIDDGVKKGFLQHSRARNIDWPYQGRPKQTDWYTWNKVLRHSLLDYGGKLIYPLKKWVRNVDDMYLTEWE